MALLGRLSFICDFLLFCGEETVDANDGPSSVSLSECLGCYDDRDATVSRNI